MTTRGTSLQRPMAGHPGGVRRFAGTRRRPADSETIEDTTTSKISAVGAAIPDRRVTTAEIEQMTNLAGRFGIRAGTLERLTGVSERRWADPEVRPSELAAAAGRDALMRASVSADDLDTVIFAGITRDQLEPATANNVAEQIGARQARVFDVSNACNGLIDSVNLADSLIRTRKAERVLVTTGERASIAATWEAENRTELLTMIGSLAVSDGGGALLLESSSDGTGIQQAVQVCNPTEWRTAVGCSFDYTSGDNRPTVTFDPRFISNGSALLSAVLKVLKPAIREVLRRTGWSAETVDLFLTHEASHNFVGEGSKQFPVALRHRLLSTVGAYGNSSTCSIPLALLKAIDDGTLESGTKLLIGAGSSGASATAMTVQW